jgi:hypothetical protein
MSAAAMANWAAGNSGVGPGVNKRVLRIIVLSPRYKPKNCRLQRQPHNTHLCCFCELFFQIIIRPLSKIDHLIPEIGSILVRASQSDTLNFEEVLPVSCISKGD